MLTQMLFWEWFLLVPSAGAKVRGFGQGFHSGVFGRGFGQSCSWSPADGDALHCTRKEVTNKRVSVCLCTARIWSRFWSRVSRVGS